MSIKIACISDTHLTLKPDFTVDADTDYIIHCGDFTMKGELKEITKFTDFIDRVFSGYKKLKKIILIAGNHDISLDYKENEFALKQ
mmetsp:Transcript_40859/g.89150  ORF Transcript_40859/g.89150 Transcript_40859/m.89150 type:complete len:86 (-) Transcript_40859:474-731(-)